jgi:hypothetical protein
MRCPSANCRVVAYAEADLFGFINGGRPISQTVHRTKCSHAAGHGSVTVHSERGFHMAVTSWNKQVFDEMEPAPVQKSPAFPIDTVRSVTSVVNKIQRGFEVVLSSLDSKSRDLLFWAIRWLIIRMDGHASADESRCR